MKPRQDWRFSKDGDPRGGALWARHHDGTLQLETSSVWLLLKDGDSPAQSPSPRTEVCTRLTYAARGFTSPGWPCTVEADKRLLTLQLVSRVTVEGGSAPRMQIRHTHIPVSWPGWEAAAQKVCCTGQGRGRGAAVSQPFPGALQMLLCSQRANRLIARVHAGENKLLTLAPCLRDINSAYSGLCDLPPLVLLFNR